MCPKKKPGKSSVKFGKTVFVCLLKITKIVPSNFFKLFCFCPKNPGKKFPLISKKCVFCVSKRSRNKFPQIPKNCDFCVLKTLRGKSSVKFGKTVFVCLLKITKIVPSNFFKLFCFCPKNPGKKFPLISKKCVFCVSKRSRNKFPQIPKNCDFCVLKTLRGKSSVKFGKTVFVSLQKSRKIFPLIS